MSLMAEFREINLGNIEEWDHLGEYNFVGDKCQRNELQSTAREETGWFLKGSYGVIAIGHLLFECEEAWKNALDG